MGHTGWWEVNSLNGPTWSLMWEYIANILYALFIRHFSKIALGIFVALAALLTIDIAFNIDTFWSVGHKRSGCIYLYRRMESYPDQLYIGISRLLYPFFVGLLLSRVNKLIKIKRGFYWCSLLIAAILVMPRIGGTEAMWMNGCHEAFLCTYYVPFNSSDGSRQQCDGKTFRSHLPFSESLLPSLYHIFR